MYWFSIFRTPLLNLFKACNSVNPLDTFFETEYIKCHVIKQNIEFNCTANFIFYNADINIY